MASECRPPDGTPAGRLIWSGPPENPKLQVRLPPQPERADPPDRKCRLCEEIAPGWDFSRYGHPDVCGNCVHRQPRRISLSKNWQAPMGGMRDETLINTMKAVCRHLEGKHVWRR